MKVVIRTLGCRLNQQESEAVAAAFTENNIILTSQEEECDLAVINTCTVTSKADRKNRQGINSLVKRGIPVLVMGCYAAVDEEKILNSGEKILVIPREKKGFSLHLPALLADFPEVAGEDLFSFIKAALESFSENNGDFDFFCTEFANHTRGFLKIQDGCNHGCTYCRTVLARGKSRSIPPETALERVQALEKAGICEVMITGVNLAQYEKNGLDFPDLMQYLLNGSEKINFRISSFHPEKINDKFLKMAENPRIMPHFHLSVQSGSDDILKKMA
ncbi:MAG: radical SAM protein, partial [Spirochaetaceae bacterium]|nr:radical SAM protein [Spirochaetaceae bacterium]